MIEIENLTKKFGSITALDDISLEISRNETFGIIGPNGAGKTTLVRILCGALKPTEGRVKVGGYDVVRNPIEVKSMIGYLPEEPSFYERLTAARLLKFFGSIYGIDSPKRIYELLDFVGLSERADSQISTFSKGMRHRLAIARALLHDPEVLILDEPTMGLDPGTARYIREFIARQNKTTLICTHYMDEADMLCDRIGILSNGRLVAVGEKDELKKRAGAEELEDVFVYFVREFGGE